MDRTAKSDLIGLESCLPATLTDRGNTSSMAGQAVSAYAIRYFVPHAVSPYPPHLPAAAFRISSLLAADLPSHLSVHACCAYMHGS